MKNAIAIIMVAVIMLTLTGCTLINKIIPTQKINQKPSEVEEFEESGNAQTSSKLYDCFLRYTKQKKEFDWEEFNNILSDPRYSIIEFDDYYFVAYDAENEGLGLAGTFTTDGSLVKSSGTKYGESGITHYLLSLGYYISIEDQGGYVFFEEEKEKYYISFWLGRSKEVSSIDDVIEYIEDNS